MKIRARFRRLASIFLCMTMLFNFMPVISFAEDTQVLTSSMTNTNQADGVTLTKTATYDPSTGKVTTVIDAYTTGTVTQTNVSVPTDIVLVLDTSGSMEDSFSGREDGSNERLNALKTAVTAFINATKAQNAAISNAADKHAIAIVEFASNAEVVSQFTTVDETGANALNRVVRDLVAGGATSTNKGMASAHTLLTNRNSADNKAYENRNKVVIVFTDGEPTTSTWYSPRVAAAAVNEALAIKELGATVYAISIMPGAAEDGNTTVDNFMRHLSSNYPNSYGTVDSNPYGDSSSISSGAGPYATGYYMTASNADQLNSLFESISQNIGTPTISLGTSASVVDAISDYFTLAGAGDASGITVQTAAYQGGGVWTAPEASSLTATIKDNDTITVTGFNFDENYISETARDDGSHGKKLIISFETTPNYDAIDAAAPGTFTDGKINTNAKGISVALLDSVGGQVAYAATPVLPANTVTYYVDGVQKAQYLRFPGAAVTVLPKPDDTTTHTYSAWTSSDVDPASGSFTMPAKDVRLDSASQPQKYTVYYNYIGTVPTGTDPMTAPEPQLYEVGAAVDHPTVTPAAGYAFSGWTENDGYIDHGVASFTMIDKDLHFYGSFEALGNTYKVEHYLQNLEDDGYTLDTAVPASGKTGETVTGVPNNYTGFTYNEVRSAETASGVVLGDGSLVLKLYYDRTVHKVSYHYTNTAPGADPEDPTTLNGTFRYGETVTIAEPATALGYTFSGWLVVGSDITVTESKFTMPARDVIINGHFDAAPNKYRVVHYMMNVDGTYTDASSHGFDVTDSTVLTGKTVTAEIVPHTGYYYDESAPNVVSGVVAADSSLVLKLYYARNQVQISYQYDGTVPGGATPSTDGLAAYTETFRVGGTVIVRPDASAPGYTFSGWRSGDVSITDGKIVMPNHNVTLHGSFTATGDTPYIVRHWFQNIDDDNYTEDVIRTEHLYGKAGEPATAVPLSDIIGCTYNPAISTTTGIIDAVKTLELNLYYDRSTYSVSYQYTGVIPSDANPAKDALISLKTENVKYGTTVTVAPDATAIGYTFGGWDATGQSITLTGDTFTMPAEDVIFYGRFNAELSSYTVEHYLMGLDGTYADTADHSIPYSGVRTGDKITVTPAAHVGYEYDADKTLSVNALNDVTVLPDGKLVIKVYYKRNVHNVTYEYVNVPVGVDPTEAVIQSYAHTAYYGESVAIKPDAAAPGYQFSGWYIHTGDTAINAGKMVMPDHDVVLHGIFNRLPSAYSVEHWLEDEHGNYTYLVATDAFSIDVNAGDSVTGTPRTYNTYTYDAAVTAAHNTHMTADAIPVPTGVVNEEGTLVLKLYYSRNAYDLTYRFEGNVPAGMTAPAGQSGIKHGHTVDLEEITAPAGYVFDGWYYGTDKADDPFTMPRANVELVGHFAYADGVKYQVKYYLQNINDDGYTEDTTASYVGYGKTGDYVFAATKTFPGFTYNDGKGAWNGHIKSDGSLVLELYYDRNTYTVNYFHFGAPPADAVISMDGTPLTLTAPEYLVHSETVRYGTAMTVKSALTADNANYEFRGWNAPNLPGYTAAAEIAPGTTFIMPMHDVDFFGAMYDYIVYYDLDGGTLGGSDTADPKHVNWNDANLLPAVDPEKTGTVFSGWTYEDEPAFVTSADKYSELAEHTYVTSITLKANYAKLHNVTYSWTNAPDGDCAQTLPNSAAVVNGGEYQIDTKYQNGTAVQKYDEYGNNVGTWTFSGWDQTGSITVTADVQLNGNWTYVVPPIKTWEITYSWTNAPDGEYAQTLPASATVVNGAPYAIDTVYTDGMTIEQLDVFSNKIGTWTFHGWSQTGTIPKVENDIEIIGNWTYEPVVVPPPYIPPVIVTDGDVILTKVDGADHETVLANAVFELYEDIAGEYDHLVGVYTTDANGQIRVNDLEAGTYYFMEVRSPEGYLINSEPLECVITAGGVVNLTWENIKANIPDVFSDDHYAYIIGRDDGLSHPEAEITRAEVATIFFRLLSDETRVKYMTNENPFSDVPADLWCNTAISTMHAMGIIFGRGDNTFDPTGSITRAEFAAIAARFEVNGNTTAASFTDIYDHWAQKEINIAANNGWALGYEDGTFRPDEKITRAEAMAMVNRVLQRIPEHVDDLLDDMVIWPDNMDTTTWYYLTVQEATNSHYYGRRENGYEYWTELRPVRDWAALEME